MKKKLQQFGFVKPKITPDNYILGGFNALPKVVLRADGQWDTDLPEYEPQFNAAFDSFGCTCFGTLNALEIFLKRLTGKEYNFSERFIYILARIRPPGADPHHVAEVIREHGLIENSKLPFTDSFDEFLSPDPMSTSYLVEGQRFPYEFKHEWLWTRVPEKKARILKIREALKYSPVAVSVTAWYEKDGVYVDRGEPNTHWCVIYGWNVKGFKVFDSYDQSKKILSFDHKIQFAKRYHLEPKKQVNWVSDLLGRITKLFK